MVVADLRRAHPGIEWVWRAVTTHGDRRGETPLAALGGAGAFTSELENALLAGEVDVAVHSMKDLPTREREGLAIAAVPLRQDARDALVALDGRRLADLPHGAVVGTGSLRRSAQLLALRPDLKILGLRGNLDTRLRRVAEGRMDGIVVALAGLNRLGYVHRATEAFAPEAMMPAAGQGALAVQTRADDTEAIALCGVVEDDDTRAAVIAERALLAQLGCGCRAPVGALASVDDEGRLRLRAAVFSPDGKACRRTERAGPCADASGLGAAAAEDLLAQGAGGLTADSGGLREVGQHDE